MSPRIRTLFAAASLIVIGGLSHAQEIIVDNLDPEFSFTGPWFSSVNAGFYGSNSLVVLNDGMAATAIWQPELPADGVYEVAAWWVASNNRALDAPYRIEHAEGSAVIRVDQREDSSQFNTLGQFPFTAGTSGRVLLANNDSTGEYLSADAVRFVRVGNYTPAPLCGIEGDQIQTLQNSIACDRCVGNLLPGSVEPHPTQRWTIQSDLPERFLTPGVLYATTPILPPFNLNDGTPLTEAQRTQVNNGFTTIDGDFDIFWFHISAPGDGSQPRRVVAYARNDGDEPVTLRPKQIIITDGLIGNVHEMESNLGRRYLEDDWDTPYSELTIPPGQGRVFAYSKQFSLIGPGADRSQNINSFGQVRAEVESEADPELSVFVVGIPANANIATLTEQTEPYLAAGAQSGETAINLAAPPPGCALSRATGVFESFVWRNDPITIDAGAIPAQGYNFSMALPEIQGRGCPDAVQTGPIALHPIASRSDTIGNYMIEYRVSVRLVNRSSTMGQRVDLRFGKGDADVGLAWQIATGAETPSDDVVDARPVRTAWAGPNQSTTSRSFFEQDGGEGILLKPCEEQVVSLRFLVLGNASLPFNFSLVSETEEIEVANVDAFVVHD